MRHIIICTCIEVLYKIKPHNQSFDMLNWESSQSFPRAALCGLSSIPAARAVTIFGRSGPFSSWQQACGFCDDNSHMVALQESVHPWRFEAPSLHHILSAGPVWWSVMPLSHPTRAVRCFFISRSQGTKVGAICFGDFPPIHSLV